ncbi:MAG: hypothetical protein HETSPECPRED_004085 [Heterodermia speciosa]|uniref:Uncharacterized protein n=1 Tax=Heterodermia speciosa TaxID=116794 RepID=A0A8H3ILG4_9LECA|nr:MAG: hypothetical protein HETSPECPRED_004085 [Heterodermia speciosa]
MAYNFGELIEKAGPLPDTVSDFLAKTDKTEYGPDDTASPPDLALLKKLADQQTIATRKKADDEEPKTYNADEKTSLTDTNASKILIPLIGGMDCDEAKNFRGVDFHWAQIIRHEDDQLVTLPMTVAKTFKNWKGANI